ncbi:MAG: nucleotidyl transferase AbiEii/AbiGii toxin family protein [Candidatus Moraniibacteriota bacterium]
MATLSQQASVKPFYLAGGTALALQLGHRESVDLDFFQAKDFSLGEMKQSLSQLGKYTLTNEESGTIDGVLDEVKVTFLRYEYPLLFPLIDFQGISVADMRDIACMKLDTVSARGSRKDFVDIFFLLKQMPLVEVFELFEKKYQGIQYNRLHLLKSLTYFVDAEEDPMPKMLMDFSWEELKETLVRETTLLLQ